MNADANSLKKVELGFGYEIFEYELCRWTNMYTRALNMNIPCLAWNKGKFIQANFKLSIMHLPFCTVVVR